VSLPVSKATIASRLSLTPEYFSRVLHELEAAGLVRIDKRDVHILDVQRLAPTSRADDDAPMLTRICRKIDHTGIRSGWQDDKPFGPVIAK
jgi:DNA-binding IclR family transcriptional regulator